MNERIKELMEESGTYIAPDNPEVTDKEIEFLGEQIVRECIHILNKRYMGDNNREDMEVKRCIEDVKKHFGIE